MRVEVVENVPQGREAMAEILDDTSVKLALLNFRNAIQSDDSLFEEYASGTGPAAASGEGRAACTGEFLVTFRDEELRRNRGAYFQLIQKLMELLEAAGSQDVLAAKLCLVSEPPNEARSGAFSLWIKLEATGNSSAQAALRWGLGLAQIQQALLFTSRYLRQQIAQKRS